MSAKRSSLIKRKSTGLIESVTRVNVSDGIYPSSPSPKLTNGRLSMKNRTSTTSEADTSRAASRAAAAMNGRQLRSASAACVTPAVSSLDSLGGVCPVVVTAAAMLGSSSSTDENEPPSAASIDYNSDEESPLTNVRLRFQSSGAAVGGGGFTGTVNPMRYLAAARNGPIASSNSSLNGSLCSATSTATKLTVCFIN
jgi:hypothetical protein